jgi:hypothetical protein
VIILDTQHLSQLQLVGTDSESRLTSRLKAIPFDEVRITIISPFEQYREVLGRINASSARPDVQVEHFEMLGGLLDFYAYWQRRILPFDQAAVSVMSQFTPR